MSRITLKLINDLNLTKRITNGSWVRHSSMATAERSSKGTEEEEFRILNFTKKRERFQRKVFKRMPIPPPRAEQMPTDQNWSNVWPGPRTFHPAVVPLPLHQGYVDRKKAPPGAKANAELMKIPNFLHLTPPAIRAQCEALKKFCTAWPQGLETDELCDEHMPLEVISSDYCHGNPSIRNPLSRIVSIRVPLSKLPTDEHAKDKILRLLDHRYDEASGYLTIVADRCPTKKQNLDYAMYLLTAVYHEAWTFEPWESEKSRADMEVYIWHEEPSKKSLAKWAHWSSTESNTTPDDSYIANFTAEAVPGGQQYAKAVEGLMNEGENEYQMNLYKKAVLNMFGLRKGNDNLDIDNRNKA